MKVCIRIVWNPLRWNCLISLTDIKKYVFYDKQLSSDYKKILRQ